MLEPKRLLETNEHFYLRVLRWVNQQSVGTLAIKNKRERMFMQDYYRTFRHYAMANLNSNYKGMWA